MECLKRCIPIERCKAGVVGRRGKRSHEKPSGGNATTVDSRHPRGEMDESNGSSHFGSARPYSESKGYGGRGRAYPGINASYNNAGSGGYNRFHPGLNGYRERSGYMRNDESIFGSRCYGGGDSYTGDDFPLSTV